MNLKLNAENARLWATYCDLRDALIAQHHDCLKRGVRTPRNVWLFVVGRDPLRRFTMPAYRYPKRLTAWLRQAVRRCEKAKQFPESL